MARRRPGDAARFGAPGSWSAALTLVDTSVWIEVFRKVRPVDIESLVGLDDVVTCLPVIQEVPEGFRDENASDQRVTA